LTGICFTSAKISPDVSKLLSTYSCRRWLAQQGTFIVALLFISTGAIGQPSPQKSWDYSLTVDGYLVPDDTSYATPTFTADHKKLHLEGRYNYENLRTGSVWIGYNFSVERKHWSLELTPIAGGVFGRTNGIAPGCEMTFTYRNLELYFSNEYVYAFNRRSDSFYYAWPQLSYPFFNWLRVGAAAQRTKAYKTEVDVQRGFLVGVFHENPNTNKTTSFTTYVFNPGITTPTVVLEARFEF
jgi:hypothetical protein